MPARSSHQWLKKDLCRAILVGAFFIFFGLQVNMAHAASWYNPSWQLRQQITIDHTKVGGGTEDETNFPVLISLSGLSYINANGSDIRFTSADGVTLLPREIESYSGGNLVAWVNAPTVSHTTSTIIYMYYDNAAATEPAASDTYGSQAVWSIANGYTGVWHLNEGTGSTAYDSTVGGNTGSWSGTPSGTGGTYYSSGYNQPNSGYFAQPPPPNFITISSSPSFSPANLTASAWVKTTSTNEERVIFANLNPPSFNSGFWMGEEHSDFFVCLGASGGQVCKSAPANYFDGNWHLLTFTYNNTTGVWTWYMDGSPVRTLTQMVTIAQSPANLEIGVGTWSGNDRWDGSLEDLRISSTAHSVGWVATEYQNQNSPPSFYAVSSPMAQNTSTFVPTVVSVTPVVGNTLGGTSVTITGTGFTGTTAVDFGSTSAESFTVASDTTIIAITPTGTTGTTVDVTVTNALGTSVTRSSDRLTFYATPVITGLSSISGSTLGGTSVTITGTGFTGTTAVNFGSTPAESFTLVSDTSIIAIAPAGTAGTVDVMVTNPVSTHVTRLADRFTYYVTSEFTASDSELIGLDAISPMGFSTLPYFKADGTVYHEDSSYDRTGNNQDLNNFLYTDPNNDYNVLLDTKGPGEIDRIWFTGSTGSVPSSGQVQIYFDGSLTPAVNTTLGNLLNGVNPPFMQPLVGYSNASDTDDGIGHSGYFIDLPMEFAKSVKVEDNFGGYYNIDYRTFATSAGVTTFDPNPHHANYQDPTVAATQWNNTTVDPKSTTGNIGLSGSANINAGASSTIANITGVGSINSVKFQVASSSDNDATLNNTWIEMYFDGQSSPSVNVPFSMFFADSQYGTTHALPVGKDASGTYYCYFPMPYDQSAKIVLVNQNGSVVNLSYQVQYNTTPYLGLGNSAGYFSAYYNNNTITPFVNGQDYELLNLTNTKGQYVGMTYSAPRCISCEGNAEIYVDGSLTPQIQGTGTEDWFEGAYYWDDGPFTQANHGVTFFPVSNFFEAYRFDLNNPISFNNSIKLGIQHGGTDTTDFGVSSVAFYYALPSSNTLTLTDTLTVGNSTSQTNHSYAVTGKTSTPTHSYYYEGESYGSYGPLIADTGDTMTGHTQFTMAIDPANKGVKLRRRMDYSVLNQKAEVWVNGSDVGSWYDAGQNTTLSWRDSDFEIPASLTQGQSSLNINIVYDSTGGTSWTEYDYWAYSYLDINNATPTTTASPSGGSSNFSRTVALSCSDGSNAGCYQTYYTTDGSTPTTASAVYSSPINVSDNTTLHYFSLNLLGNAEPMDTTTYSISPPSISASPVTVTVVNNTLTVATTFAQTMNTSITPSTTFNKDASYFTSPVIAWSNGSTTYTVTYAVAPNVTDSGITATVSGAQDPSANVASSTSSATFIIDTLAPTGNPVATAVVNVANNTLTVLTTFSKGMNTGITPSITFNPNIVSNLTTESASWTSSSTYSASYTATSSVNVSSVATVSGAQDLHGNVAPPTSSATFIVDTLAPTGNPVATAVVNVANNTLTVLTTFSKGMNTGITPSITFNPNISSNLTAGSASWTSSSTYSASYTATSSVNVSSVATVSGAQDLHGNVASSTSSATFIVDTLAPTITIRGTSPATVTVGSLYADAGATALDNVDGDLTSSIIVTSTVNTSIIGTDTVTYTVSDSAGNAAAPVTRTVDVVAASASTALIATNGVGSGFTSNPTPNPPIGTTTSTTAGMSISQMQTLLASLESQLQTLEAQAGSKGTVVATTPSYVFSRDLQFGMTGPDVKQLQLYLIAKNAGPAARKLKAHGTTENFATLTFNALIEFQKSVGIKPASGYFGPITRGWVKAGK